MPSDHDRLWPRLEPILDEALDRDPGERDAFLERVCAGDAELLAAARDLIAATDRRGPLDRPLPDLAGTLATEAGDDIADPRDRRIGPWKLTDTIGSGGMVRVYRAERV